VAQPRVEVPVAVLRRVSTLWFSASFRVLRALLGATRVAPPNAISGWKSLQY